MSEVELAPFSTGSKALGGFIVANRWPDSAQEWAQLLTLVVRVGAVPGLLGGCAAVLASVDDRPEIEGPIDHPVGVLMHRGPVVGEDAPEPGSLGQPQPGALMLLHPPAESKGRGASGCVLLPGIPHLGLDHRAAWVETEPDGSVSRFVAAHEVDPDQDPDTAVLALLLAA